MVKEFDPKSAIYTPPESAQYALDAIAEAEKNAVRAVPLDLFGDYFPPLMPGELCIVQAQTSNYKSGFLHWWERKVADFLNVAGRGNEIIIHISVEELVEVQAFLSLSRETDDSIDNLVRGKVQDWGKLRAAAVKIGSVQIFRIGSSLARAEDMPNLYLSNMYRSVRELVSGEVTGEPFTVAAVFIDYLQAFPFDPEVKREGMENQRRLQVREDIYRCRQMAAALRCPVILAAQSRQKLDGANPPLQIPGVYDIEETAASAQRADRILSLWLPKTTYPVGHSMLLSNATIKVDENLLFVKIGKQRGGLPAGRIYKCRINYQKNDIALEAQQ